MKVRIRETTFQDRRTAELRRYSDSVEEGRWRARVWLNERRRGSKVGLNSKLWFPVAGPLR